MGRYAAKRRPRLGRQAEYIPGRHLRQGPEVLMLESAEAVVRRQDEDIRRQAGGQRPARPTSHRAPRPGTDLVLRPAHHPVPRHKADRSPARRSDGRHAAPKHSTGRHSRPVSPLARVRFPGAVFVLVMAVFLGGMTTGRLTRDPGAVQVATAHLADTVAGASSWPEADGSWSASSDPSSYSSADGLDTTYASAPATASDPVQIVGMNYVDPSFSTVTAGPSAAADPGSPTPSSTPAPARVTVEVSGDLLQIVRSYWPESEVGNAMAVVGCESHGRANAIGARNQDGTIDWGVFQLNDGGTLQGSMRRAGYAFATLRDAQHLALNMQANVKAAYGLWQNRGWSPWACAYKMRVVAGLWSHKHGSMYGRYDATGSVVRATPAAAGQPSATPALAPAARAASPSPRPAPTPSRSPGVSHDPAPSTSSTSSASSTTSPSAAP